MRLIFSAIDNLRDSFIYWYSHYNTEASIENKIKKQNKKIKKQNEIHFVLKNNLVIL
jgi:hypothetical protein